MLGVMGNESLEARALYLSRVEKLSGRQIARILKIGRRRLRRILSAGTAPTAAPGLSKAPVLEPYRRLIGEWYRDYPRLKAKQIWERLKPYGCTAGYVSVVRFTRAYRKVKPAVYHTLEFLPGEEAQVDWFFFRHPALGMLAGFLYVLSFSRYAWGRFYPRTSFEFFLAGHLECFEHLKGLARRHRYDNLKSVVLGREPAHIEYNPQFLDFARFFGFSIHACNPASGNEKGRVERLIRDVRGFLYGEDFMDLKDLNLRFWDWLCRRNQTVHRTTAKTPLVLLGEEKLLPLPGGVYSPVRIIPDARVSKTALVEFETNRYSVPSGCASKKAEIIVWPEKIEICVSGSPVACHIRSFERRRLIQNPLHSEKLLDRTGHFKFQRILQLIRNMDPSFRDFLDHQTELEKIPAAYEIFRLLKIYSRAILVSAIRELIGMGSFKIKALRSLLHLPAARESDRLWPTDPGLLHLDYPPRSLEDYDPVD